MTQNQISALAIDKATATDKISDKISTLVIETNKVFNIATEASNKISSMLIETDKVHGIPKATTLSGIVYEKGKTGTNYIQFL